MEFETLLSMASHHQKDKEIVRRYSTTFGPPKKEEKPKVQSAAIKAFLQKKEQEKRIEAVEFRKKKDELLAKRAENSKNNKRAKLMASRTKDNDFSRIRLTEDEVEAKKKREREIQAKEIADKRERMRQRIELEARDAALPHKRKQKHKDQTNDEDDDEPNSSYNRGQDISEGKKRKKRNEYIDDTPPAKKALKPNKVKLPPRPVDFSEFLKLAETKQHEPITFDVSSDEDDRPKTKKEKRVLDDMEKRKQGIKLQTIPKKTPKLNNSAIKSEDGYEEEDVYDNRPTTNKTIPSKLNAKGNMTDRYSNHYSDSKNQGKTLKRDVEKPQLQKKPARNQESNERGMAFKRDVERAQLQKKGASIASRSNHSNAGPSKTSSQKLPSQNGMKQKLPMPQKAKNLPPRESIVGKLFQKAFPKPQEMRGANLEKKTMGNKNIPVPKQQIPQNKSSHQNLDKRHSTNDKGKMASQVSQKKLPPINNNKGSMDRVQKMPSQKYASHSDQRRPSNMDRNSMNPSKKLPPKPSSSHMDQRRPLPPGLREIRPPPRHGRPMPFGVPKLPPISKNPKMRRIESDSEEDEDMRDFIVDDDDPYKAEISKQIGEIFGYDRSKYAHYDDDDDECMESSFAQQMKEESRSTRIGRQEDLEDMRKELEELRRKKMRKKK